MGESVHKKECLCVVCVNRRKGIKRINTAMTFDSRVMKELQELSISMNLSKSRIAEKMVVKGLKELGREVSVE